VALYSDVAMAYAAKYRLTEARPIIEGKRQAIFAALRNIDDGYSLCRWISSLQTQPDLSGVLLPAHRNVTSEPIL